MVFAILPGGLPGPLEMLIIAAIALLLFGNRLPGAARNLGRSLIEFKKGMRNEPDEAEVEDGKAPDQIEAEKKPEGEKVTGP